MHAPDTNPSQGFKATEQQLADDWVDQETYWRDSWQSRPYTSADLGFDFYRPAYRYGYESARSNAGRLWDEIEPDLRSGWDRDEQRGRATWDNIKEAVRDAWNRATNR
ncbi:MAG: hypothetical protein WD825_04105 [Gemmatimonadaceae bacterium]